MGFEKKGVKSQLWHFQLMKNYKINNISIWNFHRSRFVFMGGQGNKSIPVYQNQKLSKSGVSHLKVM